MGVLVRRWRACRTGSHHLQHIRGFSPLRTGSLILPVAVATRIGAHLGSRLVGRINSHPVAGTAVSAAGTVPLFTSMYKRS
ncbi:hypothetical protein ACWC10_37800 [Streptomyces sp. NPDC001595]|uniref:hypothetical protein n=1 Tax=Streptomyces sp. NPDC001532 TaxID=3154520 RepID=UPI003326DDB3